jgi:hypothetical protein
VAAAEGAYRIIFYVHAAGGARSTSPILGPKAPPYQQWNDQQLRSTESGRCCNSPARKSSRAKHIKAIEAGRSNRRGFHFDAQEVINRRKEQLLAEAEAELQQKRSVETLFPFRWCVR